MLLDVGMVYQVQKEIITDFKLHFPYLSHVTCFSDGYAGQYKNCKNLYNLCHHKPDYNIDAKWMFFATSHGKEQCDGIGCSVKQLVSNASLQYISNFKILNPHDMFQYPKKNIQGIKFIFITKDELTKTLESLEDRFAKAITIPASRSYHELIPLSENTIAMKYCSNYQEVATTFSFLNEDKVSDTLNSNEEPSENVKALDFVSCYYDNYWWIGLILEKDDHQEDYILNSCIPMDQVHHLCGHRSKIFARYQITTSSVKLLALLRKLADLMLLVKLTLQIFYQKLTKTFII